MANIGSMKKNENGYFMGKIDTLAVSMGIALRELHNPKPNAPRFEVHARSRTGGYVKVGALWEQVAGSSGEAFLQGSIDDPSMDKPMSIACFMQEDGSYNIAWTRPRANRELPAEAAPAPTEPSDDSGFPFAEREPKRGRGSKVSADLGESTSDAVK